MSLLHALSVMGRRLFEVSEGPGNGNNGVCTFGPCGDGGVPLPVNLPAEVKEFELHCATVAP